MEERSTKDILKIFIYLYCLILSFLKAKTNDTSTLSIGYKKSGKTLATAGSLDKFPGHISVLQFIIAVIIVEIFPLQIFSRLQWHSHHFHLPLKDAQESYYNYTHNCIKIVPLDPPSHLIPRKHLQFHIPFQFSVSFHSLFHCDKITSYCVRST